jgi:Sulfotransferase family
MSFDNISIPDSRPIFLIGNPRSGTSLLRSVLNAHPNIVIAPECGFAHWLHSKYKTWGEIDAQNRISISQYTKDLINSRKFKTWEISESTLRNAIEATAPKNYSNLTEMVYKLYKSVHKLHALRWGDKNNYYINHISLLHEIFPKAVYLYIIRDPRDVACSYLNLAHKNVNSPYYPELPTQLSEIVDEWIINNNAATTSFQQLPYSTFYSFKYEDLVTDTQNTVKSICTFLNEEYDPSMLVPEKQKRAVEPQELMYWKEKLMTPISTSSVGRYKTDLSTAQIDLVENKAQNLLLKHKYHV